MNQGCIYAWWSVIGLLTQLNPQLKTSNRNENLNKLNNLHDRFIFLCVCKVGQFYNLMTSHIHKALVNMFFYQSINYWWSRHREMIFQYSYSYFNLVIYYNNGKQKHWVPLGSIMYFSAFYSSFAFYAIWSSKLEIRKEVDL